MLSCLQILGSIKAGCTTSPEKDMYPAGVTVFVLMVITFLVTGIIYGYSSLPNE